MNAIEYGSRRQPHVRQRQAAYEKNTLFKQKKINICAITWNLKHQTD